MKKYIIMGAVGGVVVLCGAFYGGYAYAKSKFAARGQFGAGGFSAAQFSGRAGQGGNVAIMRGGAVAGEIISKDASSVTVKMQDGSTKLVLIGTSTPVVKTTAGTAADLSVGTNIAVMGSANSDGSVTAQSVTLRPQGIGPR